ncbi:hypothetical protein AN639_06870 [Candidatus Epulonipiscium fishelsonii]|uniref:Uncharacterized protein n=1 Tax=Candidatus Epulonipiscium fishelsonii TaxID=77094 RepID=A0ACC8XBB0_9FIRM|nr:hypothetical protein AN639_06870 [Epulopiscium sp. SCG-B05WGA-EpuloA1]ONI39668.1 hypothetical protein AN396_07890 [Epulopiscium sp. SCG-B11WGA-EpuloA1]
MEFLIPLINKVSLYSVSIEHSYMTAGDNGDSRENESFAIMSSDGKEAIAELKFSYTFDENNITTIYESFKGKDGEIVETTFIKPTMVSLVNSVSTQYPIFDIYGSGRNEINTAITKAATEYFNKYGILIDKVSLTQVVLDEQTRQAIQQKVNKMNEIDIAQSETKIAEEVAKKSMIEAQAQAERNIIEAQAQAERKLIETAADAEATILKAEAEKQANLLRSQSLTQELLIQNYIEKWDGQLPTVSGSENAMLFDMNLDNLN